MRDYADKSYLTVASKLERARAYLDERHISALHPDSKLEYVPSEGSRVLKAWTEQRIRDRVAA